MKPVDRHDIAPLSDVIPATTRTWAAALIQAGDREKPEENVSPAEASLAVALYQHGITDYRQQHPLGPYFADFWFPDTCLVVEVDGRAYHQNPARERKRNQALLDNGAAYVLHLAAFDVFKDPIGAVRRVITHNAHLTPPEPCECASSLEPGADLIRCEYHSRTGARRVYPRTLAGFELWRDNHNGLPTRALAAHPDTPKP